MTRGGLFQDRLTPKVIERLVKKLWVAPESGCWKWTGHTQQWKKGGLRGRMSVGGCNFYVHRLAYAAFIAPIPEGMTVEHTCRNTLCCNPKHLTLLTHEENVAEGNKNREQAPF